MASLLRVRAGAIRLAAGLGITTLLLVGWFGSPTTSPRSAFPLDAEIERQVRRAVAGRLGLRGLKPLGRESGELLGGESRSFEMQLRRGERFLAVGVCDRACGDLDLALSGPENLPLYADHAPDAFPVVGTIAPRSGRYTVRVGMVSCARRCRFSLAFLVTRVGDPDERDRLGEATRLHAAMVDTLLDRIANDGHKLRQVASFQQSVLWGGQHESSSVEIPRAGKVLVAAACDYGCEDLDLFFEDELGAPLARDEHPDPDPLLWVDVPTAGTYRVIVRMEHCLEEPCAYAASVLAELPESLDAPVLGNSNVQGSCFAVHPNGIVATAAHVVAGATGLRVHLADGAVVDAELHAIDSESDLAVLRVPRSTPDFLPLAPAATARLGLRVFTLGFPALDVLGENPKFSEGVVAGLGGRSGAGSALLQITVPIQPGSSGGPLVTEQGDAVGVVVGVHNADFFQASTGRLPQSINYAVSSELLAQLLPPTGDSRPPLERSDAIERARAAACWIDAIREPAKVGAQSSKRPTRARSPARNGA